MQILYSILHSTYQYSAEVFVPLLIGFLISGVIYVLVPDKIIEKVFGQNAVTAILLATIVGVILPVCCFGSLPIAITMKEKGAKRGAVLAFLVATPATSVSALLVMHSLMGISFTMLMAIAVIIMGLVIGFLAQMLNLMDGTHLSSKKEKSSCCEHETKTSCCGGLGDKVAKDIHPILAVLKYGLWTLPKSIGLELLLGIVFASILINLDSLQTWMAQHLVGVIGYGVMWLFSLTSYVCSTASVPLADAFMKSGLSQGQAMLYLLMGPITSYGSLLVLRKSFGHKLMIFYIVSISTLSILTGLIIDYIL